MAYPNHEGRNLISRAEVEASFGVELRRCPFCSGGDVALYPGPLPHLHCRTCEADGPLGQAADQQSKLVMAIDMWNTRITPKEKVNEPTERVEAVR